MTSIAEQLFNITEMTKDEAPLHIKEKMEEYQEKLVAEELVTPRPGRNYALTGSGNFRQAIKQNLMDLSSNAIKKASRTGQLPLALECLPDGSVEATGPITNKKNVLGAIKHHKDLTQRKHNINQRLRNKLLKKGAVIRSDQDKDDEMEALKSKHQLTATSLERKADIPDEMWEAVKKAFAE